MTFTIITRPKLSPDARKPVYVALFETLKNGKAVRIRTNGTKKRRQLQTNLYNLRKRIYARGARIRSITAGPDCLIAWLEKK